MLTKSQNSKSIRRVTKLVSHHRKMVTVMVLTWYRHFKRNGGLNLGFTARQTSRFHYGINVPVVVINIDMLMSKLVKQKQNTMKSYKKQSSMMVVEDTEYFSTKSWYLKKNFVRDLFRRISSYSWLRSLVRRCLWRSRKSE